MTDTLKLWKSRSLKIFSWNNALSTIAAGEGPLYFSIIFFSKDPPLTPILIEQLLSFAALTTSLTLSIDPILPGLILKQDAPDSAASIALL